MKRINCIHLLFIFLAISIFSSFCKQKTEAISQEEIKPYKTDYLKVSELHELFYQLGGNPEGKPVMVLHGGPGVGCHSGYFEYFSQEKFHIVLHDQRGAGLSKPNSELQDNNTQSLVEDIEKLRKHLKLDKVILFGGSWGATLALAYAETYPENVSRMILRGVFTARKQEIDHFYHGGTSLLFPEVYQELLSHIDHPEIKNYPAQLLAKIQSPDSLIRMKYALAWAKYEGKIAFLNMSDQRLESIFANWPYYAFSLIENYYMANKCFLEEGQLLNNTDKIADIPTTIINGRYDIVCPPITAYQLHKKMNNSKLFIIEAAGHSAGEPGIKQQLIKAVKEFE